MDLNLLKKELPYKWRVQSFSKHKASATCVAYIDARDAMDLLDEVVGMGNWRKKYYELKNNIYCSVGIKINGEWVEMDDCGTESSTEKQKGEASDSFKRACVGFGIGRFLYSKDVVYLDANEKKTQGNYPYCVDKNGKQIYDITTYINNMQATKKAQDTYKKAENKPVEQPKKEVIASEKVTNIDKKVTTKDKIIALLDELIQNKDTFEARVKDLVSSYITTKDIDLNSYDWFTSHYQMLCVNNKLGMMDQEAFNKAMRG